MKKPILSPLFKWPGGKRWILNRLVPNIDTTYKRYVEPFVGGGALFFGLDVRKAILSDINKDLVQCYRALKKNTRRVYSNLSNMPVSKKFYYQIRDSWNRGDKYIEAARFIYLLQHSWNGLYRVNQNGKFNVPFRFRPLKADSATIDMNAIRQKLRRARILNKDFEGIISKCKAGDLIFVDPPYYCDAAEGFHRYNAVSFSSKDKDRLYKSLIKAESRGADWILTNGDYGFVKRFKGEHLVKRIARPQTIAGIASKRKQTYEYLVLSGNKGLEKLRASLTARGRTPARAS